MLFPDISFYQGKPNFDIMKSKTDYVILKAGQGNWVDPQFIRNRAECVRVGLNFGVYWFYDDRFSPTIQANKLLEILAFYQYPLEIWCDWERTYLGKYNGLHNVVAFMERVEELTDLSVGMYTGYYWFLDNSNAVQNASHYRYLKDKPLWLAWYTNDNTDKEVEKVRIPKPWFEMDIWQFGTPSIAREYGIFDSIEIDMNKRFIDIPSQASKKIINANFSGIVINYKEV